MKKKYSQQLMEFIDAPITYKLIANATFQWLAIFCVGAVGIVFGVHEIAEIATDGLSSAGPQVAAILALLLLFGFVFVFTLGDPVTLEQQRRVEAERKRLTMTDRKNMAVAIIIAGVLFLGILKVGAWLA